MLTPTHMLDDQIGPYPREVGDTVRDAMRAALKGDFTALDRIELEYVNLMARLGKLQIRDSQGALHDWMHADPDRYGVMAPFVVELHRGAGPKARLLFEWRLLEVCRRCAGLLRHVPCRVCEGRWWIDRMADYETIYTDADGVIQEGCE